MLRRPITVVYVTAHTHETGGAVIFGVIAHSHADDTACRGIRMIRLPTISMSEDGITVVQITDAHTHASNRRVVVVRAHEHDGVTPTHSFTGVDQTKPHLHAVEHNGKYAIHVHSVLSGAGTVTLSNTGSPKLVKGGDAPAYKDQYLATKGQALGDLRLTFEAAGTMVKGAGIMIELPTYEDSTFPQFYPITIHQVPREASV